MRTQRRLVLFLGLATSIAGLGLVRSGARADAPSVLIQAAASNHLDLTREQPLPDAAVGSALAGASARPTTIITVTVSGTVTGPDGPVPDVWINANAGVMGLPYSQDVTTDSSGFYSLTIQTGGQLNLHARPPLHTRLAEVNNGVDGITGSFTHDFHAPAGHLLSLRPADEAGEPLAMVDWQLLAFSLLNVPPPGHLPEYHLMWDDALERYECVVLPDVYTVQIDNPPAGTIPTTTIFDLRGGDQVVDLVFSRSATSPTVSGPPDASKITVGPPDGLGEALVTGAPGATVPAGYVVLTNLSSWHLLYTVADPDGSFSGKIYAPPGSALYIQHGSLEWVSRLADTSETYDVFPGTLINVPHTQAAGPGALPFAAVGSMGLVGESATVAPHVSAAWAVTGTLRPISASGSSAAAPAGPYAPGDWFHTEGTLRIYGPGITTPDVEGISAWGDVALLILGNRDGVPLMPHNAAITTRLTASGFPIRDAYENSVGVGYGFEVTGLHLSGDHAIDGTFSVDWQVPNDMPPGTYRPVINLAFNGVPISTGWLAPNTDISYRNYRLDQAPLPPIVIAGEGESVANVQLTWRLMMDDNSQGTRGAGAREDVDRVGLLSFIATQGAPYIAPPVDSRSGSPITYSLEPVVPMVTSNVSTLYIPPSPPLIPLSLPGGSLSVETLRPDGTAVDLGSEPLAQSAMRARTTWGGYPLNTGTTRVDHGYAMIAASDRFRMAFDQYGHHVITVTGVVTDLWGNPYPGGGTYDVWVAEPLDMATGTLPGTPFDVGDSFNPALQLYPGVPALVDWVITEYPDSDPAQAIRHTSAGWANRYGYFDGPVFAFTAPGEYRVDLVAQYEDQDGTLWMGARTWGGVVMTPAAQAQLSAHGRRGINNLVHIPNQWFVFCRDLETIPGATPHTYAPYFNGDILWSRLESIYECSGEALQTGGSTSDLTGGVWASIIQERFERMLPPLDLPGDLDERIEAGEIPLVSSTRSGRPPQMFPGEMDQVAYMYFSSQRPGVRVREDITEDYTFPAGYWRFETLYDDQEGVGLLGDLPNDYKYQFIGAVFHDIDMGHKEYAGQGTAWIHLPDDDELGSRVMPPFAGPGNGGWTTEGGPLMHFKGRDIHMFIQPTGTLPGAILHVGDRFRFAGHLMPTLDSQVAVTVTAPGGALRVVDGRANRIGYFFDPEDDFVVQEPGLWAVDVRVWHDGQIGTGEGVYCDPQDPFHPIYPCPSGDVLGSQEGRYWFYVVPREAPRLDVASPVPGRLSFDLGLAPIAITGTVSITLSGTTVDYTLAIPGFILAQDQVTPTNGVYTVVYDPVALHQDFPNLDLVGRDDFLPGLADTVSIALLLRGKDAGKPVYRANALTIQGEQVFVGVAPARPTYDVYLPLVLRSQ